MTDRELHKMMIAMTKEHWRSIDTQWKNDPELCHAMGYEAGYKDAVAPRVEPRSGESGAGFESLPASPTWWDDLVPQMRREWQGLTDEEIATVKHLYDWTAGWTIDRFARAIEAKLKERNT